MNKSIKIKMIQHIMPAVILTLAIVTVSSLYMSASAQKKRSYALTLETARNYASRFDGGMAANMSISRTLSAVMENYSGRDRQEVINILYELFLDNPHVLGTYVGYEPNAFDGRDAEFVNMPGCDGTGRFFPFWNRLKGEASLDVAVNIDTSDYYTLPKQTLAEQIIEPYYYEGMLITSLICPIVKDGRFTGVGGIDLSLEYLDKTVRQIKVMENGYAFLLSKTGIFVSFPKKEYIGTKKLSQYGLEKNNPDLTDIAEFLRSGKEGFLETEDPISGRPVVMFYSPLATCNWGMVVVAPVSEILADARRLKYVMLGVGLFATALIALLILFIADSLTRPIIALTGRADEIAAGNLEIHLPDQDGEIGQLSRSFNNMASQLKGKFKELLESEARVRVLLEHAPDGILVYDIETDRIVEANAGAEKIFGCSRSELLKAGPRRFYTKEQPDNREVEDSFREHIRDILAGKALEFQRSIHADDGKERVCEVRLVKLPSSERNLIRASYIDITHKKKAADEKERLQEQLVQAQKNESVGRLAGGVAHDFNNMLGVIIGHVELAMEEVETTHPLYSDLQEIKNAANRSANLTRQLLAYARKQPVLPKALCINDAVDGMLGMLERLIGENIDLTWLPGGDLLNVIMDPSQVDQILANLCVNARDAIAGTGKVVIETSNLEFDEEFCRQNFEFSPGKYVSLTVSDNGSGMEKETLKNVFEPFFTTKSIDQGTGLGLATVYGIVKQNKGVIQVWSEPEKGTTFRICLPGHSPGENRKKGNKRDLNDLRGLETILLVEDEAAVLKMTKMMLSMQGYNVLAASTPEVALELAENHEDEIQLLVTDVIMPNMTGRELAKRVKGIRPDIKALFMSGYTANVIALQGVLDEGVHFIEKPFTRLQISEKVRTVLDL